MELSLRLQLAGIFAAFPGQQMLRSSRNNLFPSPLKGECTLFSHPLVSIFTSKDTHRIPANQINGTGLFWPTKKNFLFARAVKTSVPPSTPSRPLPHRPLVLPLPPRKQHHQFFHRRIVNHPSYLRGMLLHRAFLALFPLLDATTHAEYVCYVFGELLQRTFVLLASLH